MKIEVSNEPKKEPRPYPKLMICKENDMIALFKEPKKATVLHPANALWEVGGVSESFSPDKWIDFTGTITLSND